YCAICWTEALQAAPSLMLGCGHIFHAECIQNQLKARWSSPNISFACLECPLCHARIQHGGKTLVPLLGPLEKLYSDISDKAMQRLKHLNLESCKDLTDPASNFYKKP